MSEPPDKRHPSQHSHQRLRQEQHHERHGHPGFRPPLARQNHQQQQKRQRSSTIRTIPSFLRYMEGLEVVVELKTGRRIQGILVVAEDDMNITLKLSPPVPSMPSSLSSSSTQKEQTHHLEDQQNNEVKRAGLKVPMGTTSNDQEKETTIFDVRSDGFLDDCTDDDMSENPIARSSSSSAAAGASGAINNNINVHIRGSSIRYIQFPDNVNPSLDTLVSVGMERERLAKQKYQKTMKR